MDKTKLKGLLLQYTIVCRMYLTPEKKRQGYIHLTDGYIHVQISREQREAMLKAAEKHPRYEVGVEVYANPTGDKEIDGFPETKELQLESTIFHHVFIRPEYLHEIFADYNKDRLITFLSKTELVENQQKKIYEQKTRYAEESM